MLRPEFDITCRGASFVPEVECVGDQFGGGKDIIGINRVDGHDFVGGILSPPIYNFEKLFTNRFTYFFAVAGGRFAPEPRASRKNSIHRINKVKHAVVAYRVFDCRKKAVVGVKANDVPGVDDRATVNPSFDARHDFCQRRKGVVEISFGCFLCRDVEQAVDLTVDTGSGDRHNLRLLFGGLGIAHPSEDRCQAAVDQLRSPSLGQLSIEVLPHAAERLEFCFGLDLKPLSVFGDQVAHQIAVKLISVAGDDGQQGRKCCVGIVRRGASPRDP